MITKFKLFESKEKETIVISGFPGIGKSHFFRIMKNSDKKVLDSDSSLFSWIEKGVRNPDFPNNYMKHIKENLGKADIILVSSHDIVRDALVKNNIPFTLVYPSREIKEEFINRYKQRGSDENFIKLLDKNWDNFIDGCENQKGCNHVTLKEGEYLSDIIENLEMNESFNELDPYGEEDWDTEDTYNYNDKVEALCDLYYSKTSKKIVYKKGKIYRITYDLGDDKIQVRNELGIFDGGFTKEQMKKYFKKINK